MHGLIYRKVLSLSKSTKNDGTSGKIINLISSDLEMLDVGMGCIHDIWKGPLEAPVYGYIMCTKIGVSAICTWDFIFNEP